MIKKIFIFTVLLLIIPSSVQAQGAPKDLNTCEQEKFCQGDKYILKANCDYAPQYSYCRTNSSVCAGQKFCFCTYDPIGECKEGKPVRQPWEDIFGSVDAPTQVRSIGFGGPGLGNFLSNIISLVYMVAGIIFLFMMLLGAFGWITSGGDKDALNKARGRIMHAIIGLIILAVTFLIIGVIGQITGFKLFLGQPGP